MFSAKILWKISHPADYSILYYRHRIMRIRQIESGDIGSVQNVSLDDFEPAKIVKSILEATR